MFPIYQKTNDFIEPNDSLYYLVASNGLFLIKRTPFFTSSSSIFIPRDNKTLGWLQPHRANLIVHPPKKIPRANLSQIIAFFRAIHKKHAGSEVINLIYWDEAKQIYHIITPEQDVAPNALPYYKVGENPPGMIRFGTIHSHGSLSAFHSSIDKKDEQFDDGIHITIGNVDSFPSFSAEAVCDGFRWSVNLRTIIEDTEEEAPFPNDWMKKVTRVELVEGPQIPLMGGGTRSLNLGKERGVSIKTFGRKA